MDRSLSHEPPVWGVTPGTIAYRAETEQRVRAGFIGCGSHSYRNVFPAFHYAPVELVAVCDVLAERADQYAREFGAAHAYTDYREMLAKEQLDCVFVVTNYDEEGRPRYPQIAIDAMRAGCHVWIEKPPAASLDEVDAMIAMERETGKFVQVGFKKMFNPAYVKAREISQREEFGGLSQLTVRYPQSLPPPKSRFALATDRRAIGFLDHIFHPMAMIQYLGGDAVSMMYLWEANAGGMIALFNLQGGAIASLHSSGGQSAIGPREHVEIIGKGAHIVIDNGMDLTYYRRARGLEYGRAPDYFTTDDEAPLRWTPEFSLGVLYNDNAFILGYVPEIRAFCQSVLPNTPPARAGLRDTRMMMQVYEGFRQPAGTLIELTATPR